MPAASSIHHFRLRGPEVPVSEGREARMDRGTGDPERGPERERRYWPRWTRTLTPEQKVKALVALGRLAEFVGLIIRLCE